MQSVEKQSANQNYLPPDVKHLAVLHKEMIGDGWPTGLASSLSYHATAAQDDAS